MTILLTGAAGFIGSHTTERLLELGHTVIGVDNFTDYYNPEFKKFNIQTFADHENFILVNDDIADFEAMERIFKQHSIDMVIHLAAQAGVRISIEKPLLAQKTNIEATYNLLELCHQYDVPDFTFASSSSVYGNRDNAPFSEDDVVDNPISPYAATKKACELIAYTYHHLYGMNCIGLRFFTVYGERGRPDMSPYKFADFILHDKPLTKFGDGSSQRDYTYIDDIVNGILACVGKDFGYEIFNLGNSNTVTLNEYIATFEKVIGKKAIIEQLPDQPGDVKKTFADISKAKEMLGWEPTTNLEEGLTKFIAWFTEHRMNK